MNTSTEREPAELRLHSTHKAFIPAPDKQSPEWLSFLDGLNGAGPDGIPPIFITPKGEIMDGRWRWEAAKLLKWEHIVCMERPEEQCALLMAESLLGAKKMTRGAAVYLVIGFQVAFIEASNQRRVRGLSKQRAVQMKLSSNLTNVESVTVLCERWGVSRETYYRAVDVRKAFDADPDLKAELEPQLLNGEKNLWNVLSYIGGKVADQSERGFKLLVSSFNNLRLGAGAWNDLTRSERDKLLATWEKTSAEFPSTMRAALVNVLSREGATA